MELVYNLIIIWNVNILATGSISSGNSVYNLIIIWNVNNIKRKISNFYITVYNLIIIWNVNILATGSISSGNSFIIWSLYEM